MSVGASVVQLFLKACRGGLCGFVGSPDCRTVEEEGCQIYRVVDEFSLEMPPSKPKEKRSWPNGSPCTPRLPGILSGPNKTKLSFEWHRSQYPAKQGPVGFVAGALQVHGRHRLSSLSCFRSQRLIVWTMASQPFLVRNPSCVEVSCHVFGNGSQQGLRCETSKSLSFGHPSVAAVLTQTTRRQHMSGQHQGGQRLRRDGCVRDFCERQRVCNKFL